MVICYELIGASVVKKIDGVFIAGLGIPGSGKSSVMKELAKLMECEIFLEPEEELWSDAVKERDTCGYFTSITWFRSIRVPYLYSAYKLKQLGKNVIVDSYYDKAMHYCIGKKGMDWFIPSHDKYFSLIKELMQTDLETLPDADCIVSFEIEYKDWLTLLNKRNRNFDEKNELDKTFCTQSYFIDAAEELAKTRNMKHIRFKQKMSTPIEAAQQLQELLKQEGVI